MTTNLQPSSAHCAARPPLADDLRWARIIVRDKSAHGQLWYSVSTTGVYCRPSCPSRTANPKNVALHDTIESARATGFRPCHRCNPDGLTLECENAALVAKACRIIEDSEEELSLDDLAAAVDRSPSYFHRMFKVSTGLTPKAYASGHRTKRVCEGLEIGTSITEAMYDAGFNSSGRFYEKSNGILGMTPTQYREGGLNEDIKFAVGQSCLGAILVASSTKGVALIVLGDDPDALVRDLQDRFPKARLIGMDRDYDALIAQVCGFVENPGRRPRSAARRARHGTVAGACAANNIAVAIPCRRVVCNHCALSGYAWGVDRKRALLDREAFRSA